MKHHIQAMHTCGVRSKFITKAFLLILLNKESIPKLPENKNHCNLWRTTFLKSEQASRVSQKGNKSNSLQIVIRMYHTCMLSFAKTAALSIICDNNHRKSKASTDGNQKDPSCGICKESNLAVKTNDYHTLWEYPQVQKIWKSWQKYLNKYKS